MKKTIYPKTKRFSDNSFVVITEKLDGSNLSIFKAYGELYIATRNTILSVEDDVDEIKTSYKGLYGWLEENKSVLNEQLHEGSVIIGEWLGMGKIKYPTELFPNKFYMFAKANINQDTFDIYNLIYNHNKFMYPFVDEVIPEFIGVVPIVETMYNLPSVNVLDMIYDEFVMNHDGRDVEGFIIEYENNITKYVRMKRGILEPHKHS